MRERGFAVLPIYGLILFFLIAYIIIKGMLFEPMQERSDARWRAFSSARTVQTMAHMDYFPEEVTPKKLQEPFSGGMTGLQLLNTYVRDSGRSLETGYPKTSLGHALSLSNEILTGDTAPKMLPLNDMQAELHKREMELARSAQFWR